MIDTSTIPSLTCTSFSSALNCNNKKYFSLSMRLAGNFIYVLLFDYCLTPLIAYYYKLFTSHIFLISFLLHTTHPLNGIHTRSSSCFIRKCTMYSVWILQKLTHKQTSAIEFDFNLSLSSPWTHGCSTLFFFFFLLFCHPPKHPCSILLPFTPLAFAQVFLLYKLLLQAAWIKIWKPNLPPTYPAACKIAPTLVHNFKSKLSHCRLGWLLKKLVYLSNRSPMMLFFYCSCS